MYVTRFNRRLVAVVAFSSVLACSGTASAITINKCAAGKTKCAVTKLKELIACHVKAEGKGIPVDPACLDKARAKFDGGTDYTKGCFEKLEAKQKPQKPETVCPTHDDTAAIEIKIDGFVLELVTDLDPRFPAAVKNKCSVGKKKCASAKLAAQLGCHVKAEQNGQLDRACLDKARVKFAGGPDPTKGCFEQLEAKQKAQKPETVCLTTDDTAAIGAKIDVFVSDIVCKLDPASSTCTAPTAGGPTPTASPTPPTTSTPAAVAVDFTADGYFTRSGGSSTFHAGLPPASTVGYLALPGPLTHGALAQLQQDCVDRINLYRSGVLKFTGGTSDPGVPKPPLTHLMGNDVCSSEQALGDLFVNNGAGGCAGAHTNAFTCPFSGAAGENTCCSRSGTTYPAIQAQLYSCLQQMWDEGIGLPDNAPFSSSNGHWHNMRNVNFRYLHCGFAFNTNGTNGAVWMNQDFGKSAPAGVPLTCSCAGKHVGDPDGCGGTCVAAN